MIFGRILVVSFWFLPLMLGKIECVISIRKLKSGTKRFIRNIRGKIYLYGVCAYYIFFSFILF